MRSLPMPRSFSSALVPLALAGLVCSGALGCAPDLRKDYPFDGDLPAGEYITTEPQGDGTFRTRVDATAQGAWVYFDLDTQQQQQAAEAAGSTLWDLGFQRYKILTNSGASGAGSSMVAVLPGTSFESLTQAPADGYQADVASGSETQSAFNSGDGWYAYDLLKHQLAPREITYVVRTDAGAFFKLRLESYYDEAGTGGKPLFHWGPVAAP